MTKEMYEDLLERNKLQISELNTLTEEQDKHIAKLENENAVLKKALNLYVNWADECGIAWDNFPDEKEKWLKIVEEKGLGWIDGLIFMVIEEAKEQLTKEE